VSGLKSRIKQIEHRIGTDDDPRGMVIWFGPHYLESWVEFNKGWDGNDVDMRVKTPDRETDPETCLTSEQRALIRPGDSVVWIMSIENGRDDHLELNKPPWKRASAKPDAKPPERAAVALQPSNG
jgi:hypothetical protein